MTVIRKRALILRTCNADMTSRGGFVWPEHGRAEAPDWDAEPECGGGLHGILWGEGDWFLASWSPSAKWIVAEIDQYIDLRGKVKFPHADVLYCGDRHGATRYIIENGARGAVIGSTVTGGHGSTVTGGYCSTVTGGDHSSVTGGARSTVTGGDYSTVTGGARSTVTGGYRSILQLWFFDGTRDRIATAYVGENGIKPNTPYRLNENHEFVEARQ